MNREITYNELWILEQDIQSTRETLPALAFFNENRFQKFFKDNKQFLFDLHDNMSEIQNRYIVHDAENNPVRALPTEGKAADWQYLETMTTKNGQLLAGDQVREAYLKEANEFLLQKITIKL